jgi:hypothetical protein
MTALVEQARYQLGLDNAEYNRASQEVARSNEHLLASLDGVAAAEERVVVQTYRNADAFEKLEARYDRTIALEVRRQNALAQTARVAEEAGISGDRLAAQVARVNAHYDAQASALGRIAGPLRQGQANYRQFGSAIQQAGFQVGDFAVQIASGQSPIRAFIQQGTQLISMFGPWGAVIGAGGAVVGALATALWGLGDATDDAAKSQEMFNKVMEDASSLMDEINGKAQRNAASLQAERRNQVGLIETQLRNKAADLKALQDQVDAEAAKYLDTFGGNKDAAARFAESNLFGVSGQAGKSIIQERREEVDGLTQNLKLLRAELGYYDDGRAMMGQSFAESYPKPASPSAAGSGKGSSSPAGQRSVVTRAIEEQHSALVELMRASANENELLSATGTALEALKRERAVEAATLQAQAAAQKDYNAGLRDSPLLMAEELAAVQQVTAANYDLTEAQKERGKVAAEASRTVTEEVSKEKQVFIGFIDQATDRIGSGLTEAFATGQIEAAKLGDIGRAVFSELAQLAWQLSVMNPLKNWINGNDDLPDISSVFEGVFDWIGGLGGSTGTNGLGIPLGHASGGRVSAGKMYMVGESGPEPFIPEVNGRIMPNHELASVFGGRGGGSTPVINIIDQRSNKDSEPVEARTRRGSGGRDEIDVYIRDKVRKMAREGELDAALSGRYGLNVAPKGH